jgi:hypothetical protein
VYRVGQNHIYTVYIRYFWQGNHQIYGHIRRICTVLANPRHLTRMACLCIMCRPAAPSSSGSQDPNQPRCRGGPCIYRPAQRRSQDPSKCQRVRALNQVLAGLLLEGIAYSDLHKQGHKIQVSADVASSFWQVYC